MALTIIKTCSCGTRYRPLYRVQPCSQCQAAHRKIDALIATYLDSKQEKRK